MPSFRVGLRNERSKTEWVIRQARGDMKKRLGGSTCQELITPLPLGLQEIAGRRMHRDELGFSELRVPYGNNPAIEIDVFEIKSKPWVMPCNRTRRSWHARLHSLFGYERVIGRPAPAKPWS